MTDTPETPNPEETAKPADPATGADQANAAASEASLPEPTFASLTQMLFMQGMMATGLVPGHGEEKAKPDLNMMKFHIDLLEMLEEKTRGNLSDDEKSLISEMLHTLRMAYIGSKNQ